MRRVYVFLLRLRYGHLWVTPGKISEELSGETGESDHIELEQGGCLWVGVKLVRRVIVT